MKLRFIHVTVKVRCQHMPFRFWQYLLRSLNIVFAAYGMKRMSPGEPHTLYMLYEDDVHLRSYTDVLEENKSLILSYREEHNMSVHTLLKIRDVYEKIAPSHFQVDNIDDYLPM